MPSLRITDLVRTLALLPALVAGCSGDGAPPDPDRMLEPATVELDDRTTTRSDIALNNFLARVDSLRDRLERFPNDDGVRAMLVDHLLARATYLGTYDDFDEVDALTRDSEGAEGALLRAAFLSAVHRFGEALATIDEAEALGAQALDVERARIVVELALGEDPALLLPRAESLVAASERYGHLTVLASVLGAAGRYEEADATYLRALDAYRDTSPFTLAWVSFVRGVMWGEAADRPDLAEILYRDALSRLPEYVVANTHLSELEDDASAIVRLERVMDGGDPEPAARLSQRVAPARGTMLVERSRDRYEELLSKHREAFLDHASEFYVIAGEPETGLALALENLELRRNGRAYVVAIGAAIEAGDVDTVCRLIAEADGLRATHRVLDGVIGTEEHRCP